MKGSLSDLGIGELVQFPSLSNKTGRIVLTRKSHSAELYFVDGQLHHATLDELEGFPVLVEILPWTQGEFEFQVGVTSEKRTIDMDLGKALMQATLQSDPDKVTDTEAGRHVASTAGFSSVFGPSWDSATYARVSTFLSEHPLFFYACVMTRKGHIKAEFIKPVENLETPVETLSLLRDIMKNYATFCEGRMVVDSSYCIVAVHPFGDDEVVIALARPDAQEQDVGAAIEGLVIKLEDPFQL